jgi:hypothetical protein
MEQVEGLDTSTYVGKAALAVKTKVRGIMGDNLIVFTLLDFVSFMNLNNKFASLGIFITNDNREESYIKIIELGDPVLIDDLETYINLKDSLALIEDKKKEYYDIINRLKDSTSDDEVNSIIKEYLKR